MIDKGVISMIFRKRWSLLLVTLVVLGSILFPLSSSVEAVENTNSCGRDRGLDIAFVLDNSGSMTTSDPTNIRISEVKKLFTSLHEYDRAAVIKFNEAAENVQSLTSNEYLINRALASLIPNGGGTNMSTGIQEALDEFASNGGSNHKIMVVLTDGASVDQVVSLKLAEEAYAKNITIYTIGLGSLDSSTVNDVLTPVATKTGGKYFPAPSAANLASVFTKIYNAVEDPREPKVYSDWTLTKDLHETGDLVLNENMKMDLNGYDLQVDGDLVLLSCSELRAVSGTITAGNIEQEAGSTLNLNNSQLEIAKVFTQDGFLRVNGEYGSKSVEEIIVHGDYQQQVRGVLDLNGFKMKMDGDLHQEGTLAMSGGTIVVKNDVVQKGYFDLGQGELEILGNLTINGGPLVDDAFTKNKSLNVNGGYLKVGSAESMTTTSTKGNVIQESGQLYVNYGIIDIFGDYRIKDGWLTMIHATMDTNSESMMVDDGDYVHVYRDFTMQSPRNHGERVYSYVGTPANDQAHLTNGILRVDGKFQQLGDRQFHVSYSDRSQNYTKDYSRFNFVATGRHKVILTGKSTIEMNGVGSQFNILQLDGVLSNYTRIGPVKWNELKETSLSANANLASLTINDVAVHNFKPTVLNYSNHVVSASGVTGPLQTLKVDARADDFRNAKVEVSGAVVGVDGTAQVRILVTAHDGSTTQLYTVNVTVGQATVGQVTSIVLDREKQTFMKHTATSFSPETATVGYTVYPKNADNQKVTWTSIDPLIAKVSPNGIITPVNVGETTITARTEDGGFVDSVNVKVVLPFDLLEGIKTLADFIGDTDRYNQIMSLYDPSTIGIVVPGQYLDTLEFSSSGYSVSGRINTMAGAGVSRVEVSVNNVPLSATLSAKPNEFLFNRIGLHPGDYIEVIAYNVAGDEVERIATAYPINYHRNTSIPSGFHAIGYLIANPIVFTTILDQYSLEELRFVAN